MLYKAAAQYDESIGASSRPTLDQGRGRQVPPEIEALPAHVFIGGILEREGPSLTGTTHHMEQPGRTAYRGFDYQIRVSTWLTLVFLFEENFAQAVVVEPLTGEDLELLQGRNADHDTGERATALQARGESPPTAVTEGEGAINRAPPLRSYIVQVKGRHVGHWTPGELHQILAGNDGEQTKRTWPIKVLESEQDVALLFVTDSTLSDALSFFVVDTPAFARRTQPRPAYAEKKWGKLATVHDEVLARFGVLQGERHDGTEAKIDTILARELNVPHASRKPLRDALHARFRAAMLYEDKARVDASEIRHLAQHHGGLPGGPDPFVAPDNWTEIQRVMREQHAIVLVGDPGTGKSTAAERLVYEHRVMDEPFRVVTPERPSDLRRLSQEKEPLIVYVEDPFGQYEPGNHDDGWLRALEDFCASLRDDLKLVVTSRSAFAAQYLEDEKSVPRLRRHGFWFGKGILDGHRLLEEHLAKERSLNTELKAWLLSHMDEIVATLNRPISYSVFVPRAVNLAPQKRTDAQLRGLLRECSVAELGKDLERTFAGEPEHVRAGLVAVWIALEAWSSRHRIDKHLDFAQDKLLDLSAEVSEARTKLLDHRWLRVRDGRSRMHPVYMEACFRVVAKSKALTARVVQRLLQAYSEADRAEDVESVFSVVATRNLVTTSARAELAEFAANCLRTSATRDGGGPAFTAALELMAANGGKDEPLAMLARALTHGSWRKRRRGLLDMEEWFPPEWTTDKASFERVVQHPDVPVIVQAFVRRGFPTIVDGGGRGAERLTKFLYSLVDVSAEFATLLPRIDQFGTFLIPVVAHGAALSRNANPARLLDLALDLQSAYVVWLSESYPYNEDSDAESEHLADLANQRRLPATSIVDALLAVEAQNGNPAWAATRGEPLVFECFADRVRSDGKPDQAVIRRVFAASPPKMRGMLLKAILSGRHSFDLFLDLLPHAPSSAWLDLIETHARVSINDTDESLRVRATLGPEAERLSTLDRVSLAYGASRKAKHRWLGDVLLKTFSTQERAALAALLAEPGADARACVPLLTEVAKSGIPASRPALTALAAAGHPPNDLIDTLLAPDGLIDDAVAALDAAMMAKEARRFDRIRKGLRHERARVRTHALSCLCKFPDDAATEAIRSMVADPTYSVRCAAAKALAGRTEPAAWRTLVAMLKDSADTSEEALNGSWWNEDTSPEYGVASAAAHALAALKSWPEDLQTDLQAFLKSGAETRRTVMDVLGKCLPAPCPLPTTT